MHERSYLSSTIALGDIVALLNYDRAYALHHQMVELSDGLRGGPVERGLATKIQDALKLAANIPQELLTAIYGTGVVEVADMQRAVSEVLDPKGRVPPFFTRITFPTFKPTAPHILRD